MYVEFKTPAQAWSAWNALRLRWYGGRQIDAELIPFSGWIPAICEAFAQSKCARGPTVCNYLHLHAIPEDVRPQSNVKTTRSKADSEQLSDILKFFDEKRSGEKDIISGHHRRPSARSRSRSISPRSSSHRSLRRRQNRNYERYRSRSRSSHRPNLSTRKDRSRSRSPPSRSRRRT